MDITTLDQLKDEIYGVKGTPRRDNLERELETLRIGVQIRNARQKKEMTQAQLAERIDKKRTFISKVENDGGQKGGRQSDFDRCGTEQVFRQGNYAERNDYRIFYCQQAEHENQRKRESQNQGT